MIRNFVFKEIAETLKGPKFWITFVICAVLIVGGTYSGYELYRTEVRWFANAVAQNKIALENLGSYGYLTYKGTKVVRPPERLSIFMKGVDSAVGKAAEVSESPKIVLRDSREGLNPIFAVFGELDLAFIVNIVLSLFALLFSYNAVSGERELGTLKQVFSNAVGRAQYIAGKAVGGLAVLFITFLVPFLLALLMLSFLFGVTFSSEEWGRVALLVLVFLLYLAAFYVIGILISSLTRNSIISFLLCLAVWVFCVVIMPKAAVYIADDINPAPSLDELEANSAKNQLNYFKEFGEEFERRLNKELNSPQGIHDDSVIEEQVTREVRAKYDALEQEFLREYERKQMRLLETAQSIARISPTSCAVFAQGVLTNTDVHLEQRFLGDLRQYRRSFLDYAGEKINENPGQSRGGYRVAIRGTTAKVEVPAYKLSVGDLPEFRQSEVLFEAAAGKIFPDLTVLSLYVIGLFGLAFVAFKRYDVR